MYRLELVEETHVVFREHTQILDTIFQIGYALHAHTESETGVHLAVDAARFEYVWIHHTATEDFNPTGMLAESATLSATKMTGDVHFSRWFGEWEIRRTQTDFCFRAKQFTCKVEQRLLQVGKRHVFIDVKSLNLMEEAVGARRDSLVAVYASGTDDADWRLLRRHHAGLHRRCVRAEQHVRRTLDEECVLHVARRMVGSEVQSREHVPVVLHFRTVGNRESETREDRDNLIADKRDRMACAERRNGRRPDA